MQREWQANYLDGQTAIRHPATVRLMHEGLEVTTGGGWARFWPYQETRQTQGFYEGEQVRLERGGQLPEVLIVSDPGFLSSLQAAAPHTAPRFHNPAQRGRRVRLTVLAAVAVIGLTGALYFWGIPALAAFAAPHVPVAWEESLGRSIIGQLAPAGQVCVDVRRQQALDAIVARLAAAAPGSPYTFRLLIVNDPQVNALALPGGTIVVFRGLLERARTPEELAGVLAHEIEHILHRHTTRAVIQHASTGLLLAALTGDMTGPLAYGLESARVLSQLQYSRHAEEEADREGMRLLLAAGISPEGLIAFFEGLSARERDRASLRYLSTHPSTRDRIAALREQTARAPGVSTPLFSPDQDWKDIQAICASTPVVQPPRP